MPNLYTESALQIGKSYQAQIERLNHAMPAILQAETLAETFTTAGVNTQACYADSYGAYLKSSIPIEALQTAINTLHTEAAKAGRNIVNDRNIRFVLTPARHEDTETKVIELTIEEI